jgi:hypothetical protein
VQIRRDSKIMEFDVDRIRKGKDKDPYIESGDIIVIPRRIIM